MSIKVEKCGEKPDEISHWEAGALYQYVHGGKIHYYCFKFDGELRLVSLDVSSTVHNVAGLNKESNRKLSKGECITLTVE